MPRRSTALRLDQFIPVCGGDVVRVRHLEDLGLHRSTIARRCRPGGPWQRAVPGIVVLHNRAMHRDDRRRAALLHGGPSAVITGLDALELTGMRRMPSPSGPVHILVPADRHRTSYGLVLVERTDRLPEPVAGRWPSAPLSRAALDVARRCHDRDQVRSMLAEIVQRGRCTPAELGVELAAGCGRGSALPRAVLHEISDGVRSVAEAKARLLLRRSKRLPPGIWNTGVVDPEGVLVAVPDVWFDDVGLAWEIDSYEWHLSPDDYDRTLRRRSAMTTRGALVVHHQPRMIRTEPDRVLAELEALYEQARRRPRPPLYAVQAADDATNDPFVG